MGTRKALNINVLFYHLYFWELSFYTVFVVLLGFYK